MEYHRRPTFRVDKVMPPPAVDRSESHEGASDSTEVTADPVEMGDQPPKFAETETGEPPSTLACFAESETTTADPTPEAPLPPNLVEAIERSVEFDGTGFFTNRKERRVDMTGTAYELLHALRAGGDAAIKLAIDHFPPGLRQRAPSVSKPELLAVQLTAKPQTTEERKACSALASLLVVAQAEGVTVDRYREWAGGIDLADAEVKAKKIRAALKAMAPAEFEDPGPPPKRVYAFEISIVLDGKRKETARVEVEDHQVEAVREAINLARFNGDLTKLAGELDTLTQHKHS